MSPNNPLEEKLVREPSMNDIDHMKAQLLMLFKMTGKSKKERARNRAILTWLGTLLVVVQLVAALTKIFKCP